MVISDSCEAGQGVPQNPRSPSIQTCPFPRQRRSTHVQHSELQRPILLVAGAETGARVHLQQPGFERLIYENVISIELQVRRIAHRDKEKGKMMLGWLVY